MDTPGWIQEKVWGLVFYTTGYPGSTIVVRLKVEPTGPPSTALGPNRVLRPPYVKPPPRPSTTHHLSFTTALVSVTTPKPLETRPSRGNPKPSLRTGSKDPLWDMVDAAFLTLNHTNPSMTTSCWLCYNVRPPFYEAIGLNITYDNSTSDNPTQCAWGNRKRGLTIRQVSGQGTCLGKVPRDRQGLCTVVTKGNNNWGSTIKWIVPKGEGWWLCSRSGLTPCLSTKVFNSSKEFCVMVAVLPRILYHSEESLYSYWNTKMVKKKEKNESLFLL
jgi:hypothetical protein